jgi:hypothetical protein
METRLSKDMLTALRRINAEKGIDMDQKSETQYKGYTIFWSGKPKYIYYVRFTVAGEFKTKSMEFLCDLHRWIDANLPEKR